MKTPTYLPFLHILLFVFSFAFTAGIGILSDRAARTGDAKAIHAVIFPAARPLSITGGSGWTLTAAVGVALAAAYGYELTATWLLFSYAAFAVLILSGAPPAQPLAGQGPGRLRCARTET